MTKYRFLKIAAVMSAIVFQSTFASAQAGPGLGNLTYNSSELYRSIWNYTEVNHYGSTMATMCNGYMINTFHPDSGKPPGGILVWDVSNPRSPKVVTRIYDNRTATFREQHALPQHGNYIMFQDGFGIQIWDFSNPKIPVQTKRHLLDGYFHDDYGAAWQIFWQAPYVFVANGSKGFDVIDASNINNPVLVKHVSSPRQVGPIFAIGNLLYTSAHDFGRGFTIYDISNPRDPKLLNSFSNTENMYASMVNGNRMIISARGNTNNAIFGTYDVSDPINIKKIATLNIGNNGEQLYNSTQDNFIFQGCQNEVVKIDASIPNQQKIVGRGYLVTGNVDHGQVTPFGNLIFVGNDHGSGSGFLVHQMAPDTKGPEVNMVIPKSNDVNRALTSRIGVTMTDNILLNTVNQNTFQVRPLGGAAISGKYSYQFSIINFSPDQPLLPNTTYEIVIPAGGIKDYAGNTVTKEFKSYFSTGPNGSFPPGATSAPWLFEDDQNITVFWNKTPNASSYIIKRSLSASGPFETVGTTTSLSYTDRNLINGSKYYYKISAKNNFGEGESSAILIGTPDFYITNLAWTSATNGWGSAEVDQSNGEELKNDGDIIRLDGKEYSRGIGVHANSTITYNLGGNYERFLSDIGVDDEVGNEGSVIFTVSLDGKEIYNSGLMTGSSATKTIDVSVSGGNVLTLKVLQDVNNAKDHASWGGARLKGRQTPFHTLAHQIPGIIEAEDYDFGGSEIAYHEANSNGNQGLAPYRGDEVDIENCSDIQGVYNVAYILKDEWLEYTVDVQKTQSYDLRLRVASDGAGKTMHLEMNGNNISGPITVPNTGGWQKWDYTTSVPVSLTKGEHILRLVFDSDYMNVNFMEFKDLVTGIDAYTLSENEFYPNVFDENGLTLNFEGDITYSLKDATGSQVEQGSLAKNQKIGRGLKTGLYILTIETEGKIGIFKVIRQ